MSQTKAQLIDPTDGSIVNADINASAAIAGTKISPDFGSQAITTTNDSVTIGNSIIHSGDTDTKINFPAANTFTINTAGSERFRVDSSGKVGIGVTNPDRELDISNSSGNCTISLRSSDSHTTQLLFGDVSAELRGRVGYQSSDVLDFYTAASERMRIDSSGRVGIGTTSPNEKLVVQGNSSVTGALFITSNTSTPSAGAFLYRPASNTLALGSNSAERMRIDSSGNVGIGTASPSANLHLRDGSGNTEIKLQGGASTANDVIAFLNSAGSTRGNITYDTDNDFVLFNVNTSERMRINNLGQVQIGDTTAADTSEMLKVDGAGGNDHCGIGVKTSNNVHDGYIAFHDSDANFRGQVRYDHSVDAMFFNTAASERMRINSSGVVCIGTTSPNGSASKLQVEDSGENNIYFVGNTSTLGARLILQNKNSTANSFSKVEGADASGQGVASIKFINVNDGNNEGAITLETRPSGGLPTERMRIDSSGRLLHGVTASVDVGSTAAAQTQIHSVNSVLQLAIAGYGNNSGGAIFALGHSRSGTVGDASGQLSNNDEIGTIRFAASDGTDMENTAAFITGLIDGNVSSNSTPGELAFGVNNGAGSNANCILIRSDFDIFLGGASGANRMFQSNSKGFIYDHDGGGQHPFIGVQHGVKTTGAAAYISFQSQTSERGKIAESNSGNNVTYNTSSDYRLKQDEVLISDGITRLKQLKPYQFKWKDNLEYGYVDGFFAHEVGDVIKGSATGSKDEVVTQEGLDDGTYNKNRSVGDMVAQGLDYSRLTPLLTAALQEAIAKIETLETEVAALKAA